MNSYFSTFFTGFDEVVEQALIKRLKNVKVNLLTDGLIIYKTTSSLNEIKQLKFLNNSFSLLKKIDNLTNTPIVNMLEILLEEKNLEALVGKALPKRHLKFRIRTSVENQFVTIDKNLLKKVEEKIVRAASNLKVDRAFPDIEFLITVRSEGFGLIGIKFTHKANYEKVLEKGELYPELTHILCLISKPKKDDVFWDPFAGHGSIPIQRVTSFPYKKIIASDIDQILVNKLQEKVAKIRKEIIVKKMNALNPECLEANSVDKIVTDPPWGLYKNTDLNLSTFYFQMLEVFCRIVKPNGLIVILTAQKELIKTQLSEFKSQLKLVNKYNTLVSGKKAGVYKIKQIN